MEHQLLTGKIEGKRDTRKQRTTYIDDGLKLLTNEKNAGTLLQKADDRENRKTLILNVCNQILHNNGFIDKSFTWRLANRSLLLSTIILKFKENSVNNEWNNEKQNKKTNIRRQEHHNTTHKK